MTHTVQTPGCVGITIPAAASYPTREVAGHTLSDVPGGLFVMGSFHLEHTSPQWVYDAAPRWVYLDRYSIGKMAVAGEDTDHPLTMVTYHDAREYLKAKGGGLRLPTEAQWENAARGPAVNMREAMEEETGSFTSADFADFAAGRFENFVFDALGQVFTNPAENQLFRHRIEQGIPFWGWRVYSTPSGTLNHNEAWYAQKEPTSVEWGPTNAYGVKGMTGGVWEWVQDCYAKRANMSDLWNPVGPRLGAERVLRGGSWGCSGLDRLHVGLRIHHDPKSSYNYFGFRAAAPQES